MMIIMCSVESLYVSVEEALVEMRCELVDNKLNLSFIEDIFLSQTIFINFIEIINMYNPPDHSFVTTISSCFR